MTGHAPHGMWLVALAALLSVGCTSARQIDLARLSIRAEADDAPAVETDFDTAVYAVDDRSTLTVVLIDGDVDQPRQAVTLRMFWRPTPGRTPISPEATNATVHYLVFGPSPGDAAGPAAVYSGAGYLFPRDRAGEAEFHASLWDSTVLLADRSDGFQDVLGPASITGRFTARHDEAATLRLINQLGEMVSARLGYPRLIERNGDNLDVLATR